MLEISVQLSSGVSKSYKRSTTSPQFFICLFLKDFTEILPFIHMIFVGFILLLYYKYNYGSLSFTKGT